MSSTLLLFAKSFVDGRLSAQVFSDAYLELWKIERDLNLLQKDKSKVSEALSTIFCAADMFVPDEDREEYELNEEQLLTEVSQLISDLV